MQTETEITNMEGRINDIVGWLELDHVHTAAELDPHNKMGLQGAFVKHGGFYPDPIPQKVIEDKKKAVADGKEQGPVRIPILEDMYTGKRTIVMVSGQGLVMGENKRKVFPLFKEQVLATAQYLAKLGLETSGRAKGKGFVFVDEKTVGVKEYPTNDPNISVEVTRINYQGRKPAKSVSLVINK